jgi:protein-S-isoprenylcysteine O-methyltransferase Ste14
LARDSQPKSRIPSLGRNGGGWVALQFLALGAAFVGAFRVRGDADGQLLNAVVALGCALIVLGVVVLILGFRNLGASVSMMPRPVDGGMLVVDGIYTYIRHPFYLGLMLVMVGFSVAMDSVVGLALDIVLAVVLDLKSRREEVWLRERYQGYEQYAARTKRFVPFVY